MLQQTQDTWDLYIYVGSTLLFMNMGFLPLQLNQLTDSGLHNKASFFPLPFFQGPNPSWNLGIAESSKIFYLSTVSQWASSLVQIPKNTLQGFQSLFFRDSVLFLPIKAI